MTDLESAYRILELKPGASLKQISEAREDLLALWDPERLSHYPRLRSKAFTRVREINQAYELLLEEMQKGAVHPRGPFAGAAGGRKPGDAKTPSASLFDEMFSGTAGGRKSRSLPAWLVMVLLLALVAVLGYWLGSLGGNEPGEQQELTPVGGGEILPEATPENAEVPASEDRSPEEISPAPELSSQSTPQIADREADGAKGTRTERAESAAASNSPPAGAPPDKSVQGNKPALVREEVGLSREGAESVRAFRFLTENSLAAGALIQGRFTNLLFTGWEPAGSEGSLVRVKLKATRQDGSGLEFLWAVDRQANLVYPLNQATTLLEEQALK